MMLSSYRRQVPIGTWAIYPLPTPFLLLSLPQQFPGCGKPATIPQTRPE